MVELEALNEHRFYKLVPIWKRTCTNKVENIYSKVGNIHDTRICGGLLRLHMIDNSINMICPHVGCNKEYDIVRECNVCGKENLFEDITCDNCEPRVIDITTWSVSVQECGKAIKKVNRAYKQDLITEEEWKTVLDLNRDELVRCEKNLENEGIYSQSTR